MLNTKDVILQKHRNVLFGDFLECGIQNIYFRSMAQTFNKICPEGVMAVVLGQEEICICSNA